MAWAGGQPPHAANSRAPLRIVARVDALMAQRVEVGIVFQMMLGDADARDYFRSCGVPDAVADRVLSQPQRRRGLHDASGVRIAAPVVEDDESVMRPLRRQPLKAVGAP